jgi:pimeloyl-ACP methyl ester carboxylesterase
MILLNNCTRPGRLCILILFSCLVSGCAHDPVPDLKRLYETRPLTRDTALETGAVETPVILVHGVFGARLRDRETGKEVWPGGVTSLLFNSYDDIALPIDADTLQPAASSLEAYAITDRAAGRDFYGAIIRTLESAGGYMKGLPGEPVTDGRRRYYILVYDWRQDNVETARRLDELINRVRADYADPDLKVDIVAHSMGGLATRYYLRYGTTDVLNGNDFPMNDHGAMRVRKVILLGTPNLGSVSGLNEFLQGFRVGLRRIQTETFATMPSAYQLFPHPIRSALVTADGEVLDRDLFDVNIWRAFQWSIFDPQVRERIIKQFPDPQQGAAYLALLERYFGKYIERARRFVWSLTVPVEHGMARLVVFGGDCELTPARLLVEEVNGESVLRLHPGEVTRRLPGVDYEKLMLEPGDGRVTKPSLFAREALDPTVPRHRYSYFPMDHSILLCESHDSLTGNISFQNNLLNILLSRDQPLEAKSMR